jgi:hypothetical protein
MNGGISVLRVTDWFVATLLAMIEKKVFSGERYL